MTKMLLTLNFKVTTFTIGEQQISCLRLKINVVCQYK